MALAKKNVVIIAIAVVLVPLVCCGAATFAYTWLLGGIEIPDMVGMTIPEARDALSIRSEITLVESEAEPGTVVAQSHEPGSKTDHDDIVMLEVAGPVKVPDIVGMDAGEAQDELYNAGYEITITYDRLASEPEGTVISQDPAGGAEVMSLSIFYVVAGSNPYPDY